jgi:hypothetical protein
MSFDDLFAYDTQGLCHLKVVDAPDSLVALAVQLSDGPGSVANGAEALVASIRRAFKPAALRLFITFPDTDPPTWSEVTLGTDGAEFHNDITHAEVVRVAGTSIERPVSRTALEAGGPRHPLLALLPEEDQEDRSVLREMQAVAVADLPWAHNLSRCAHYARYQSIDALYDATLEEEPSAGAHFFLTLTEQDLADCRYHRYDWGAIAAASVDLLDRLGPASDYDDVYALANELINDPGDRAELVYLFTDPIVWGPGCPSITNGQHRTCALKAAGAPLCAVVTDGRLWREPVPGDPARRARAVLAQHWVTRLGAAPPGDA